MNRTGKQGKKYEIKRQQQGKYIYRKYKKNKNMKLREKNRKYIYMKKI